MGAALSFATQKRARKRAGPTREAGPVKQTNESGRPRRFRTNVLRVFCMFVADNDTSGGSRPAGVRICRPISLFRALVLAGF